MTNSDPYEATSEFDAHASEISESFEANSFPLRFDRPQTHGLQFAGCIVGGGVLGILGLTMFVVHAFVIRGNNPLALHLSSTLPLIMGVFLMINAFYLRRAPRFVKVWLEGVEIQRRNSELIQWDGISHVAFEDVAAGQRKAIRLVAHDGKSLASIAGLERLDELVAVLRSAVPDNSGDKPKTPQPAHVKQGRWRAVGLGAFGLFTIAGCVFMIVQGNWLRYRTERMTSHAVSGHAFIEDRLLAPNGTTKRLYVKVEGENGQDHTHNFEVTDWLYAETRIGDTLEVTYDPNDPRVAALMRGQIDDNEPLQSPVVAYIMAAIFMVITVFMLTTATLSWKGYDLHFEKGKFRLAPIGE